MSSVICETFYDADIRAKDGRLLFVCKKFQNGRGSCALGRIPLKRERGGVRNNICTKKNN